jgi:hypothetical protein
MRRKLVLGMGLAAIIGSSASAQFASDRLPPPPTGAPKAPASPLPGGLKPVVGGFQPLTPPTRSASPPSSTGSLYSSPSATSGYVPPVDGLRPASYSAPGTLPGGAPPVANFPTQPLNFEIPTALPKDHPWLIKPEHGPYFIMVKSYVRPAEGSKAAKEDKGLSARQLAEMLAKDIREVHRVQAFLFEYISDERKAEMRAYLLAKQKAETEYWAQVRALEQKSKLQGMEFIRPDNKFRVLKHEYRDQIGVLVGGFQTEDDAKEALLMLKKWDCPKNDILLDKAVLAGNGREEGKAALINPYASAFVVPNPVIARATQPHSGIHAFDPFLITLNEGHPYNLLKAKKNWTLAVKSFAAPVEIVSNDSTPSVMKKHKLFGKSGADVLLAGELQAEAMAKALRAMKGPNGQPLNLEAFVLHTRNASLVTIGQFDSPDDPALLAMRRLLAGMRGNVSEDQAGLRPATNAPTLFDTLLPMPIPKQ